jgi:hypothetical protein
MSMPSLLLIPALPFTLIVLYLTYWTIATLYIYSVGELRSFATDSRVLNEYFTGASLPNPATRLAYEPQEEYQRALVLHFFAMLWNLQFFIYLSFFMIAGAAADWYFTPRNADARNNVAAYEVAQSQKRHGGGARGAYMLPVDQQAATHKPSHTMVCDSVYRTLRFHLGTVLFGALIIAVVQFVRAVIMYVEKQTKGKNNQLQRIIFKCIHCCLWCLECCLDKVSKNAFVWSAVYGESFASSACGSFALLWRNLGRVAAINLVGHYLLFLGKLLVAGLTTAWAAYMFLEVSPWQDELTSIVLPLVIVFIIAWAIASAFMVVYATMIDTM